ncbi:uncharacterized protein LTR77_002934 [Saxophila tyrrhenica]|uniref:MFS general substrate transporter n=1 Tax=Saxophila tyrrhenica TaxID=1690608 RepID=A0AAV9PG14_9PEZI|nr:hypothetical protein LTR77_002934 [Saxophila tyrrhenica]
MAPVRTIDFGSPFDEKEEEKEKESLEEPRNDSVATATTATTAPTRPDFGRRDSLASLSVAAGPNRYSGEPTWPRGWRPYACLFGGFLLMFNSWGLVNAYGTYASYYMQHLLPRQDILLLNLVGSTQSFVVLFFSAVVGRFLDAGYIRHLLIVGTIFVSVGSFGLSVVNGDAGWRDGRYSLIWLTQGLISGLGMACFFVSSSQVVATWFRARKGMAIGIVASGASIAGLVYPVMIRFLRESVGFNDAQRYVATLTTITSALAIFIARPSPEHLVRKPERWRNHRVFIDTQAFRNTPFMFLTAAICFLFFGFYAVFFNLEEWAASTGLGAREPIRGQTEQVETHEGALATHYLLAIMNATSTLGRISSAYLCDHFGALNVHAVVTFIASLLVLCLWTTAKTVPAAIAFVVLFGIFSGAVIGLPPASVAYILGLSPEAQSRLGQWVGMMYSSSAIFALTGPVIAGHLISAYGNNFLTVQCWSGACMFMSAVCMAIAIYFRRREAALSQASSPERRSSSPAASTLRTAMSREASERQMV